MAHFSIAHIVRLRDGTYAVLSADYPQCEGRDIQAWPAREKFRAALSEQVHALIGEGELPPGLYVSLGGQNYVCMVANGPNTANGPQTPGSSTTWWILATGLRPPASSRCVTP